MQQLLKCNFYCLLLILLSGKASAQNIHPTLNHIAVYVHDLKICTGFYRDVLHLDTIPEPFHDGKHSWFSIGPKSHLHLIQGAAAITSHDKNGHLCFSVSSLTDFIAVLKKYQVEYENWLGEKYAVTHRVDGVQQLYFKDPEGNWIEVNDAKE